MEEEKYSTIQMETEYNQIKEVENASEYIQLEAKRNEEKYWINYEKWNSNLVKTYGRDILLNCLFNQKKITNPLKFHLIENHIRRRMINWIQKVTKSFNLNERVFHLAVSIIDNYLINVKNEVQVENFQLHIIAVTALFISSKYEEKVPLGVKTIYRFRDYYYYYYLSFNTLW